ncbi:hypothetical protein D9611_010290 [Ephemerocybe angulata]|uniref:SnoaL-like domain-containing protein n=1 Tax=Ephemerocybe angulata TaxID=980116 RepID=A0A8H5BBE6_9AGAR|nr:hypothetical protein D9611_010290 [Tulosesus angulatus]
MRISTLPVVLLSFLALTTADNNHKPKGCNPKAKGPTLEKDQQTAMADFAKLLLIDNKPIVAYDKYVPGQYIQHNPFAQSGREFALNFLTEARAQGWRSDKLTFFAGQGYGFTHIRAFWRNTTSSVMDYFRFEGTCIVEHWDVVQVITGNETNPIAFF